MKPWENNEWDMQANATHRDGWSSSHTSRQTFFPGEAVTYSLSRRNHDNHNNFDEKGE